MVSPRRGFSSSPLVRPAGVTACRCVSFQRCLHECGCWFPLAGPPAWRSFWRSVTVGASERPQRHHCAVTCAAGTYSAFGHLRCPLMCHSHVVGVVCPVTPGLRGRSSDSRGVAKSNPLRVPFDPPMSGRYPRLPSSPRRAEWQVAADLSVVGLGVGAAISADRNLCQTGQSVKGGCCDAVSP